MNMREYETLLSRIESGDSAAFNMLCHSTQYTDCRGARKCREIVKAEFKAFYGYLNKARVPSRDTFIPQELFDDIIAAKRRGEFVKASRLYAELACNKVGCLSANISVAWFKVLAAAGSIESALVMAAYAFSTVPQYARQLTMWWEMLANNYMILVDFLKRKDWDALTDRVNDLAGGFIEPAEKEDIDAYIMRNDKTGFFAV